jgi:hypothetical protein
MYLSNNGYLDYMYLSTNGYLDYMYLSTNCTHDYMYLSNNGYLDYMYLSNHCSHNDISILLLYAEPVCLNSNIGYNEDICVFNIK